MEWEPEDTERTGPPGEQPERPWRPQSIAALRAGAIFDVDKAIVRQCVPVAPRPRARPAGAFARAVACSNDPVKDDGQRPAPERLLKDSDGLAALYTHVAADVRAKDAQPFASLDADPDLFESFLAAAPPITIADLRRLRPYTFNLNPALQGEVTKAVARKAPEEKKDEGGRMKAEG